MEKRFVFRFSFFDLKNENEKTIRFSFILLKGKGRFWPILADRSKIKIALGHRRARFSLFIDILLNVLLYHYNVEKIDQSRQGD